MIFTSVLIGLVLASSPGCPVVTLDVIAQEQSGPTCVVAASVTAISARDQAPTVRELARNLPIWPDGVHAYDLVVELKRRGWQSLVFTGPPEAAARLVEAGFAPMVMMKRGKGRHAVAVTGSQRGESATGSCGTALRSLQVTDPRKRGPYWLSAKTFAARQSEAQMVVSFRPHERALLSKAGFPVAVAERVDRRFRSTSLLRKAKKHPQPNGQMLTLLREALTIDPCHDAARAALIKVAHHVGESHRGLPKCAAPPRKSLSTKTRRRR